MVLNLRESLGISPEQHNIEYLHDSFLYICNGKEDAGNILG